MVTYEVKFENDFIQDAEFIEPGIVYEKNEQGKPVKRQVIPEFKIKNGEKKSITKETYDYLREKGVLLTKKEREDVEKLRNQYKLKKYNRKDKESEPKLLKSKDRNKVFTDLPFVV